MEMVADAVKAVMGIGEDRHRGHELLIRVKDFLEALRRDALLHADHAKRIHLHNGAVGTGIDKVEAIDRSRGERGMGPLDHEERIMLVAARTGVAAKFVTVMADQGLVALEFARPVAVIAMDRVAGVLEAELARHDFADGEILFARIAQDGELSDDVRVLVNHIMEFEFRAHLLVAGEDDELLARATRSGIANHRLHGANLRLDEDEIVDATLVASEIQHGGEVIPFIRRAVFGGDHAEGDLFGFGLIIDDLPSGGHSRGNRAGFQIGLLDAAAIMVADEFVGFIDPKQKGVFLRRKDKAAFVNRNHMSIIIVAFFHRVKKLAMPKGLPLT